MTRVTSIFGETIHRESVRSVSFDVNFLSNRFPKYNIGANNAIIEPEERPDVPSLKEIVAKESSQLLEQQQRLSVRDLAKRFENGLAAAAKLSDEAKWRGVPSLEKHVLLKKLRDLLEALRGRMVGRNKDEVDKAITMVEALAVQLTQREGELFLEKEEVKKLAILLKKASEDAKKVVEEEKACARAEIESARAAVQRIEEALHGQDQMSGSMQKQDHEELLEEVQEARRIKMLHQPSKVMDMEHELQALRIQLAEKSRYSIKLRKELEMTKRHDENNSHLYELEGIESLGSCLHIISRVDSATEISSCSIQWYRIQHEGHKKELISACTPLFYLTSVKIGRKRLQHLCPEVSVMGNPYGMKPDTGATKSAYAPEPFDVGRVLQVDVVFSEGIATLTTTSPIDPAAGLASYVEALVRKPETEFNVVVLQMNGSDYPSNSIHVFHIGKFRLKLSKGKSVKAKEFYSSSMQLCGVRGGGNAAAQALFWQAKKGLSFTLAFESDRERNAAIMLARRFAFDCNIVLAGPGN